MLTERTTSIAAELERIKATRDERAIPISPRNGCSPSQTGGICLSMADGGVDNERVTMTNAFCDLPVVEQSDIDVETLPEPDHPFLVASRALLTEFGYQHAGNTDSRGGCMLEYWATSESNDCQTYIAHHMNEIHELCKGGIYMGHLGVNIHCYGVENLPAFRVAAEALLGATP